MISPGFVEVLNTLVYGWLTLVLLSVFGSALKSSVDEVISKDSWGIVILHMAVWAFLILVTYGIGSFVKAHLI